ncbi:DNA-directed RNA polymerase [Mycena kentingensis (nom. inval.)]|nr:DNA-directed RNA polymerase [Mycena kentingensis (nom. inval.)]
MADHYSVNESALCYHGPLLYVAKILKVQEASPEDRNAVTGNPGAHYFVHYKGWKTTWDEWVPADRLLKDNEQNRIKQKDLKAQQNTKERTVANKASTSAQGGSAAAASTSASASTRTGTRKDLTRGTKRGRDEMDGPSKKPDMRLNIPEQIKSKLVDDWESITKGNMLVTLPRLPSVDQLLDEFEEYLKTTKPSYLKEPEQLSAAVVSGLKIYFDKALGNALLYREERGQYTDMRVKYVTGQHVKEATEMSRIYGAEHLLRMLVTMPSLIAQSSLDPESTDIVRDYVNELLAWMLQEQSRLFQEYTTNASPAYQHVACRRAAAHGRARHPLPIPPQRPYAAAAALVVRRDELGSFLRQPTSIDILPPPLPQHHRSTRPPDWFSDPTTQEMMSIMDACLHNLYDVPRAKSIFDRLRSQGNSAIDARVIDAMLEAYLKMGANKAETDYWLESLWELYDAAREIESTPASFAVALLALHRFPEYAGHRTIGVTVEQITQTDISMLNILSERVFTDDNEATQLVAQLSKAAIALNAPSVVAELAQAHALTSAEPDDAESVPEARPVRKSSDQTIPFNLSTLRKYLTSNALARRVLPTDMNARQKLLEDGVFDAAKERLSKQMEVFERFNLPSNVLLQPDLQRWMWHWHLLLTERLQAEVKEIAANEKKTMPNSLPRSKLSVLSPYLSAVKPDRMSLLTIIEIMRMQGTGGVSNGMKTTRALLTVGKAVEMEHKAALCRANHIDVPNSTPPKNYYSKAGYEQLHQRRVMAARFLEDNEGWSAPWTQSIRSQIGGVLVGCLIDVAKVIRSMPDKRTGEMVSEEQPAFHQAYEYQRGQKLGVIRLNPVVSARLAKDPMPLHPRHLPMLVKPRPWVNFDNGGYLSSKTTAMRFKDSVEQRSYLKHAADNGHVELVFQGLDVLGSTPWRINRRIFDVVLEVWNSGKRLGKIPPEVYDQPEPEPFAEDGADMRERNNYLMRMKLYNQAKAANHSERCSVNYKLEISRSFLDDVFYLPHNVDFRGRAYPIPPHLNHIGDDLSRGLLIFAEKRPLGERGFRWLKIHLSNVFGYDKANFEERVAFTEDHLDDIYDSVLNPLTGRGWWKQADDPWQCLSACMELHSAIESGDPLTYESALPVHQDGTCNGLQHYAALGGDEQGAQQVNLAKTDRPADVYSFVGAMVNKDIEADAAKGEEIAKALLGKITRKVVKQTVMTTVYGVTFVGARDQIEKQLRDLPDVPEDIVWPAAAYLAKKVLAAIGDLFSGAKGIMNWLNLCARLIAKSIPGERIPEALNEIQDKRRGDNAPLNLPEEELKKEQMTSVVWTTPLGLPICQPYRKIARRQVYTTLQMVYISDPAAPAEVNSQKQASAFPPNFIHSLDATHMMLTAIECNVQGLTFASVHDSYWTHASSVDQMAEIIRSTFIALHSSDVLEKLRTEFLSRYKGFQIPLYHLRSASLIKQLRAAGSRIRATPAQSQLLGSLSDIVEVTDSDSTINTKNVFLGKDMGLLLARLEAAGVVAEDGSVNVAALEAQQQEVQNAAKASKAKTRRRTKPKVADMSKDPEVNRLLDDILLKDAEAQESQRRGVKQGELLEEEQWVDVDDEEVEVESKSEKKQRAKALALVQLMGKFVDLADILPPLPAKGTFDVRSIKDSPYFFS